MIPVALMRNWKPIAVLIAFAGLALWGAIGWSGKRHAELVAAHEKQARQLDRKTYAEAQAKARSIALEAARKQETRDAQIQQERDRAISLVRADYDARTREWMRKQTAAAQGVGGSPNLPGASQSTGATAPADPRPFVVTGTDIGICNAAIVTARGWQDWWRAIEKQP